MNSDRRILTPVAVTVVAAAIVGAATLGGSVAGDQAASMKSDRFAVVGENLCKDQVWPNLSPECLAWSQGEALPDHIRFVTISSSDENSGITTLTRVREIATN